MRKICTAVLVAAVAVTPAFAGSVSQAPLASGKPAGVHKAQLLEGNGMVFVVAAAALGLGIAAGTMQNSPQQVGISGVVSPTTT